MAQSSEPSLTPGSCAEKSLTRLRRSTAPIYPTIIEPADHYVMGEVEEGEQGETVNGRGQKRRYRERM